VLIVNNQHTVTVEKTTIRLVTCEECETDFVYELSRSGEGYGNSVYFLDESGAKKRAARKAKEQLSRKMKNACEAIPCPQCAHVQDHMLGKARSDRAIKIGLLAALVFLLSVGGFALALSTKAFLLGIVLGGLFLVATAVIGIFAVVALNSFDPNNKPKSERIKRAEELASPRKDFERGFAENAEEEFSKNCKKLAKKKQPTFEFAIWVDRTQIKHADSIKVNLPNGERASVKLKPSLKDGDTFEFSHEVDGREVQLVGVVNIYSKTKS